MLDAYILKLTAKGLSPATIADDGTAAAFYRTATSDHVAELTARIVQDRLRKLRSR